MMRKRSVILKGSIAIVILLVFGLWIRISLGVGSVSRAKCAYLKDHSISFNPEVWAIDSISQSSFDNLYGEDEYDVYFYGEEHGYNFSHLFDLQYFKYLNEKYGVSLLLDEISVSSAKMLDGFINSEECDTSILAAVLEDTRRNIPQRYTQDYYQKWVDLRIFNIKKDSTQRIHVKGLLPDDYFEGKYSSRDEAMLASFKLIQAEFREPYYCSVGQFHAMRDTISSVSDCLPFAGRLEEGGLRIHSTVMIPASSYAYYSDGKKVMDSENGPFCYTYGIKNLMRCSNRGEVALFAIDKPDSPYQAETKDLVLFSSLFNRYGYTHPKSGHTTTDYFQSVLLIYGLNAPQEYKKSLDAPL